MHDREGLSIGDVSPTFQHAAPGVYPGAPLALRSSAGSRSTSREARVTVLLGGRPRLVRQQHRASCGAEGQARIPTAPTWS